jgi:anaerobic magnesium-protoporphyrin IX monomethyl ester cyclase
MNAANVDTSLATPAHTGADDKQRVLLINPRISSRSHARFPLSLMALAATLEGKYDSTLIDGNLDAEAVRAACAAVRAQPFAAVGVTVMGGPQVATAIEVSRAVRSARRDVPIVWGGYFPTLYPGVVLNSDYVDFAARGQGEDTFVELLNALASGDRDTLAQVDGLSWRRDGVVVHNGGRAFTHRHVAPILRYERLADPRAYLVRTFLGEATVAHQAALGCRFRCTFCGVAAMFRGATALPAAERLDRDLTFLKEQIGADSIQFYDHNFFDREEDMVPLLEVLARHELPWWCYARSDALVNLSPASWRLVRKSRLRMAYIGAETPNDQLLKSIRKGTSREQTLEVAEVCRANGVIPELSFMVAPPDDPEGETERTFDFIRQVKRVNPEAEIIVYVYTPLPAEVVPDSHRLKLAPLLDIHGKPVVFPTTPDEWTQRRWVDYACHADAPWLNARLRRRIRDFVTVLRCRFPTVQDTRASGWAKTALKGLASWRYALRRYDRPWELKASQDLIGLLDPRATSI